MKAAKDSCQTVNFTVISGINYPFGSRKYLMSLLKGVAEKDDSKFILIAGNTLAGKELERELKDRVKLERKLIRQNNKLKEKGEKKDTFTQEDEDNIKRDFIEEIAYGLHDFLPVIKDVNYHIQIAEKVFDKPLGTKILERLKGIRKVLGHDDIRLIYDTEAQVPVRMAGVENIRSVVPYRTPWFYKIITGLMQRLIDSFVSRTYSPRPSLVLAACTGVGAYLPFYQGVPSVSVPTFHKIGEQLSSENMVGCVTISLCVESGLLKVRPITYDFRTVIFNERKLLIKDEYSAAEKAALEALKPSSASLRVITFRINEQLSVKKQMSDAKVKEALENLKKKKLIVFNEKSNRYEVNEDTVGYAKISLDDFLKGGRLIRHVVEACRHIGCLKTLYHTADEDLPKMLVDADAFIDAGDSIQGIAHDYEYNGENLPIVNGFDKQQVLAANLFKKNLVDTFSLRAKRLSESKSKQNVADFINKCLISFRFITGNHPAWATRTRNSLVLGHFEDLLKHLIFVDILRICREYGYTNVDSDEVLKIINEKIVRVGEDGIAEIDGIRVGVKHPHKSRTLTKSQRVQEVINFIYGSFYAFMENVEKKHPDVSLAYVGNFHEAAAVHVSKFGRTLLGVMVGAYLKDTQFEVNKDKVVDIGPAKVEAYLSPDGQILYSQIEFINNINPEDQKLVLAKRITTKMVLELCSWLTKIFDLPWRY